MSGWFRGHDRSRTDDPNFGLQLLIPLTFRTMTVQQVGKDGLMNEVRPTKRRKVEQHDPFTPFRLVPSHKKPEDWKQVRPS